MHSLITMMLLIGLFIFAVPILYHPKEHPGTIHRTLYLDRYMSEDSMDYVIEAATEWNVATKGLVTFDVKRLPAQGINPLDAILILDVTPDYPEIMILDNGNDYSTLGFFNGNRGIAYIGLVENRIPSDDMEAVVLHELGHSLGLEHNEGIDGIGTLMYPNINYGADHITNTDLDNFCKIYGCDPKRLHD